MLFAQYMCCSPSMEVQIEETETETETDHRIGPDRTRNWSFCCVFFNFLAHLSRRLIGELIVYQ